MNKTYVFSDQTAVIARRLVAILSLCVSVLVLVVWILGVVPINHVNSDPKVIVDNLFEILNLGTKPFWYCASRALFSVLYVWFFIASCADIRNNVACKKTWWGEENDTQNSRFSATNCVSTSNRILTRFAFLFLISFMISPFNLSFGKQLIFVLLLMANFAINVARLFYLKRNFVDSIIPPLTTFVMLALLLMFMYNVYDVNVAYVFNRVITFFRGITMFKNFGEGFIWETLLSLIVQPIFHIIMLYLLAKAYIESMYYGSYSFDYIETCKKIMITGIVVTCVTIIIRMVVTKNTNSDAFFDMLMQNAEMVALCLCVYFGSKAHVLVLKDAPVYDGITITEENKSEPPAEESQESENNV